MVQERYPVQYTYDDTDSGEQVQFTFQQPQQSPRTGPVEMPELTQEFNLVVTADEDNAVELAEIALDTLAACLSFATRRPVVGTIGPITERETNSGRQPKSLFPVGHAEMRRPLIGLAAVDLNRVLSGIGDIGGERGRKIVRAMRWLYRSRGTLDKVEMFSFLAMACAALTPLLPSPRDPSASRVEGVRASCRRVANILFRTDPARQRPGESAVLTHFAVETVGVARADWIEAWRLRHELFHGALLETQRTEERLSAAIPLVRRVAIEALKDLLDLPNDLPTDDPFDELGFTSLPLVFQPHDRSQ